MLLEKRLSLFQKWYGPLREAQRLRVHRSTRMPGSTLIPFVGFRLPASFKRNKRGTLFIPRLLGNLVYTTVLGDEEG